MSESNVPPAPRIDAADLAALRAQISDEFGGWSNTITITQDMVNRYADLTGDRQWIHVDVERARRESPFGATIVHGFFLLGLMPSLRAPQRYAVANYRSAANYGSAGLRFLAPVVVGSTVRLRQRLKQVEAHKRGTLLTSEIAFHLVDSERPALVYDLQVLYVHSPQ